MVVADYFVEHSDVCYFLAVLVMRAVVVLFLMIPPIEPMIRHQLLLKLNTGCQRFC